MSVEGKRFEVLEGLRLSLVILSVLHEGYSSDQTKTKRLNTMEKITVQSYQSKLLKLLTKDISGENLLEIIGYIKSGAFSNEFERKLIEKIQNMVIEMSNEHKLILEDLKAYLEVLDL